MDKTIVENLRQFKDVDELLSYVRQKYIKNIDKFIKKDDNNKIIGYRIPIIENISSNKEIIFSDKFSSQVSLINDSTSPANFEGICKISLGNFLNISNQEYEYDLDALFKKIVNKK